VVRERPPDFAAEGICDDLGGHDLRDDRDGLDLQE
jgi:hypothetical protein